MSTVVVAGYGVRLGYRRGMLVVAGRRGVEEIPLIHVKRIVIVTSGVSISSRLVRACARNLIDVLFLDHRGSFARLWSDPPSRTVTHRRAQYEAYLDGRGVELARLFVRGKLINQATALRRLAKRAAQPSEVLRLASEVRRLADEAMEAETLGELLGVEGSAAAAYWQGYAMVVRGFPGRDRESQDPVNASLNYAYGLLRAEAHRQLLIHGLDPYAGYLHTDRSGRPSLALDLMELFRPLADLVVARLQPSEEWVEAGRLRPSARVRIIEAMDRTNYDIHMEAEAAKLVAYLSEAQPYTPWRL